MKCFVNSRKIKYNKKLFNILKIIIVIIFFVVKEIGSGVIFLLDGWDMFLLCIFFEIWRLVLYFEYMVCEILICDGKYYYSGNIIIVKKRVKS